MMRFTQEALADLDGAPLAVDTLCRYSIRSVDLLRGKAIRLLVLLAVAQGMLFVSGTSAQSFGNGSPASSFAGSLSDLDMVSPSVGWALSFAWPALGVVRSVNGGRTWRGVGPATARVVFECANHPRGAAFALFALNGRTAWLAAHCDGAGGRSERITMWHTTSAGAHWTEAGLVDGSFWSDPMCRGGCEAHALALEFASPKNGWLGLESLNYTPHPLEALFRTTDAGAHWTYSNVLGPPVNDVLGFAPNNHGYGYNIAQTASQSDTDFNNFPYVTQDGGGFWQREHVPIPPGFKHAWLWFGALGSYDTVGTVGFSKPNAAAIPVAGARGLLPHRFCATYHTSDGGTRWWYVMSKGVCAFEYLNASVGWGIPQGGRQYGLYRTTDGGIHWTLMGRSDWDDPTLYTITFATPSFGYILPGDGTIEVTDSGGADWQSIHPEPAPSGR